MSAEDVHKKATAIYTNQSHRSWVLKQMLSKDQLTIARKNGSAFSEFMETPPGFMPTFKFHIGSNFYNLHRKPAWTDRILYRHIPNAYSDCLKLDLKQLRYSSHPQYKLSDHKPVSGVFSFKTFTRSGLRTLGIKEPMKISFYPVTSWTSGQSNQVWFTTSSQSLDQKKSRDDENIREDFLTPDDQVVVCRADFTSPDEHLMQTFVNPNPELNLPPRLKPTPEDVAEFWFKVVFPESNIPLDSGSVYRLLYVSCVFNNILGVSAPFEVSDTNSLFNRSE